MVSYVYHGSKKNNLKVLKPLESGFGRKFVYACSDPIFAAIFINRPGGSFLAKWARGDDGIPYFVERKRGIFKKWYGGMEGYLYVLDKKGFCKKDFLWDEEVVNKNSVNVVKKIKIPDLKKYFEDLEVEGKFKIIKFKDRLKFFPEDDGQLTKTLANYIVTFGRGTKSTVRKLQPRLYSKVLQMIKEGKVVKKVNSNDSKYKVPLHKIKQDKS